MAGQSIHLVIDSIKYLQNFESQFQNCKFNALTQIDLQWMRNTPENKKKISEVYVCGFNWKSGKDDDKELMIEQQKDFKNIILRI